MAAESIPARPRARGAGTLIATQALALLVASVVIATALALIHVNSGDSAIYFTYFKRFFEVPFSYAPGNVSFGATSPLWVVLNAPIAQIFGSGFVDPSRVLAGALLIGGALCLAAAVPRSSWNLPLAAALIVLNAPLVIAASQLFETGLAFALVALVYFAMSTDRTLVATIGAGLLPLARPETVLMSAFVYCWVLHDSADRRRTGIIILVSLVPMLLYFGYMFLQTGTVVPSSVSARVLQAKEGRASWWRDLFNSFGRPFWTSTENLIYPLGVVACLVAIARFGIRAMWLELTLLGLLLVPFAVQPPLSFAPRYLEIGTPILTVVAIRVLLSLPWRPIILPTTTAGALLLAGYLLQPNIGVERYSYGRLLLRDLADKLNPMLRPGDKVLLYEIQGQYYLLGTAVSADGIVGGSVLPVLRGELSWEDFISREGITYIVTMDAFDYRRIYAGTLLAQLYSYDLDHPVGARLRWGDLAFTKVLTNPDFARPSQYAVAAEKGLNFGDSVRVYGQASQGWSGSAILWDSVYRVGVPR